MAIVKCRECGGQVSTKAATCPSCGAPQKSSPGLALQLYKAILWMVFLFIIIPGGCMALSQSGRESQSISYSTPSPTAIPNPASNPAKASAIGYMLLDYNWTKGGFDNVMMISGKVQNMGHVPVKDFVIECIHESNSGTVIDSNSRTIYERLDPKQTYRLKEFNMGLIHSQAARSSCRITDLTLI